MRRVLLTGFEPFDGAEVNESWEAVRLVAEGWDRDDVELETLRLPVTFGGAFAAVKEALDGAGTPFDVVVATGLDATAKAVRLERVAVNLADARIPDNAGEQPVDEPLVAGADAAHFTRLPVRELLGELTAAGIPAELSCSAGTYVCNSVFYRLLDALDGTGVRSGFVHVPAAATLPVAESARALSIVVANA